VSNLTSVSQTVGGGIFHAVPVTIGLRLGSISSYLDVSTLLQTPSFLRIIPLFDTVVSTNQPTFLFLAQYLDSFHRPIQLISSTTIHFTLGSDPQALNRMSFTCYPMEAVRMCNGSVTFPFSWFGIRNIVLISSDDGYAIAGPDNSIFVVSSPQLTTTTVIDIAVVLPAQSLQVEDEFFVVVETILPLGFVTKSFSVQLNIPDALSILVVQLDNSVWAASTNMVNPTTLVVTAVAQSMPPSSSLFSVKLKVLNAHQSSVRIDATILQWLDFQGNSLQPQHYSLPAGAIVYDRFGMSRGSGAVLVEGPVKSLYIEADATNVANTALIDGKSVVSNIRVYSVDRYGLQTRVSDANQLLCTISRPDIIHLTSDCSAVFVDGSELVGGDVFVTVIHVTSNTTATLNMSVWYPQLRLEIILSDPVLNQIEGWFDANCRNMVQWSTVHVFATFISGISSSRFEITDKVVSQMRVMNENVVVLSNIQSRVIVQAGGTFGSTNIVVENAARNVEFGRATVTVSSTPVLITNMTILPIASILLSTSVPTSYDLASVQVSASFSNVISQSTDSIYVYGSLIFDDETQSSLEFAPLVEITVDSNIVHVSDRNLFPLSDGSANVTMSLVSECGLSLAIQQATSSIYVQIELPSFISLEVDSTILAPMNDIASQVPSLLPSQTNFTILGHYPSGRIVDFSGDPRVQFDLSDSSNLFSLARIDGILQLVSNTSNSIAGSGSISVSISIDGANFTQSVTVSVIRATSLVVVAHPYPTFPLSNQVNINSLHPIAFSGAFQSAILQMTLHLSNHQQFDVSSNADVELDSEIIIGNDNASSPHVVAFARSANGVTITRSADSDFFGIVSVHASLLGFMAVPLDILISDLQLTIRSFYHMLLPNTLSTPATIEVGVLLSDTTLIPNYYASGMELFPGVVDITADSLFIAFNATTGGLVALKNSVLPVSVKLSTQNNGESTVSISSECFVNLVPNVGEVDLGALSGPAIPHLPDANVTFQVPVRINLGTDVALAVQLRIEFDPAVVQFISCAPGADWATKLFVSQEDNSGHLLVGGISGSISGSAAEVAVLSFMTKVSNAESSITATVLSLLDIQGNFIGVVTDGVAPVADVPILIGSGGSRRSVHLRGLSDASQENHPDVRRSNCQAPIPGDADFNCVFNMQDAVFVRSIITFTALNASFMDKYPEAQRQQIDADRNGFIEAQDVDYLISALFGLYRLFKSDLSFASLPPSPSGLCQFEISVELSSVSNAAFDNNTLVLFDIESNDPILSRELAPETQATLINGSIILAHKGPGFNGQLWKAVSDGSGKFFVIVEHDGFLLTQPLGLSMLIITFDANGHTDASRKTSLLRRGVSSTLFYVPVFQFPVHISTSVKSGSTTVPIVINIPSGYDPLLSIDFANVDVCYYNQSSTSASSTAAPPTTGATAGNTESLIGVVALILVPVAVFIIGFWVWKAKTDLQKNADLNETSSVDDESSPIDDFHDVDLRGLSRFGDRRREDEDHRSIKSPDTAMANVPS